MANAKQLAILKKGAEIWNKWRAKHLGAVVDLTEANLSGADLMEVKLSGAQLNGADLRETNLSQAYLIGVDFAAIGYSVGAPGAADLRGANLSGATIDYANFQGARLAGSIFSGARMGLTIFGNSDLSEVIGLEYVFHKFPSNISIDTFGLSKGKIPEAFLRGCGLRDWEIEAVKLYNPDLTNEERNKILYKIYDLQASQAIQIFPLFISYSHVDGEFVNRIGDALKTKGIRYWRDIHDLKSGRIEKQIDRAIRQNPIVLLILSEHSMNSDWVEHEVRTARDLEKDLGRDVLCPVALDDSWKSSKWPKRVMEQIMEYNILDFSEWEDDVKFEGMFRKLIDGLELFYKR